MSLHFPDPRDLAGEWPLAANALRLPAALYGVAVLLGLVIVLQSVATGSVQDISIALPMALVAFAVRKCWSDAAIYAAAHLAAAHIDGAIGPAALALITLLTLALTGRPRLSLTVALCVAAAVVGGAYLMESFASTSFTTQDLYYFAVEFSANRQVFATQPNVIIALLGGTIAIAVVVVLACFLDGRGPASATLARLAGCLALAACCSAPVFQLAARAGQEPAPNLHAQRQARPLLTFVSTLFSEPVAKWPRVPVSAFASGVQAMVEADAPSRSIRADIVLFLQESQFNPDTVAGCPPELCTLPAFGPAPGTTDLGPLRVPVHGSGTWLSEFALLTGLPHSLWGRAGRYASFNIAPKVHRTFVHSLKDAGYHTIAIHPTNGSFMNARESSRAYGFDEFLDSRDLQLSSGFSAPDRVIHGAALAALARGRASGNPVFVYALTLFNHSEHGIHLDRVPPSIREAITSSLPDTAQAESLADYAWRSGEFSKSFEATSEQLLTADRPVVIAWFGDHQPPFALAPELRKRIQAVGPGPGAFTTWYAIRSNVEPRRPPPTQQAPLDLTFLSGVLAERAGVPLDQWLAANVLARHKCMGSLAECAQPQVGNEYMTYLLDTLGAVGD